jgi:GNAT superfamily N-acetyltransferase
VAVRYEWRGNFTNPQLNELHAEAFETRPYDATEWNWIEQVNQHSLGWVVARDDDDSIVGFVNVPWDGFVHAWIQDTMVAQRARHQGIGTQVVQIAVEEAVGPGASGCTWTSRITCGPSTSTRAASSRRTRGSSSYEREVILEARAVTEVGSHRKTMSPA